MVRFIQKLSDADKQKTKDFLFLKIPVLYYILFLFPIIIIISHKYSGAHYRCFSLEIEAFVFQYDIMCCIHKVRKAFKRKQICNSITDFFFFTLMDIFDRAFFDTKMLSDVYDISCLKYNFKFLSKMCAVVLRGDIR